MFLKFNYIINLSLVGMKPFFSLVSFSKRVSGLRDNINLQEAERNAHYSNGYFT